MPMGAQLGRLATDERADAVKLVHLSAGLFQVWHDIGVLDDAGLLQQGRHGRGSFAVG
jgi:hypothetical protein